MIRYKNLIGVKVVEKETGEKIGEIGDIIFNDNLQKVIGFLIEDGKILKNKKVLPFNIITSFGEDAIMIDLEKYKFLDIENGIREEEIKFLDKGILTQDGECLGYVKDLLFNCKDGKLVGYIITEGLIEDITKGRSFVPNLPNTKISEENLIVKNEIKALISKNKSYYKKLLEFNR